MDTYEKSSAKFAMTSDMNIYEREAFLNSILASSTEYSIVAKDLNAIILAWNEGARRLYGYEPSEVLGKSAFMLHDPTDVKNGQAQAILDEVRKSGKWTGEIRRVRKNGEKFTALVTFTLRLDQAGKPAGYTMISRDLTELKRLQEQRQSLENHAQRMQEANKLKSEFLANMSHELRTPLNGIIGFAELMYFGKVGILSPEHKEYLGDILSSARHLLQLINDVLDLSKVEAGKMEFHPELVDLTKLANEVREALSIFISKKHIQVHVSVDSTLTHIEIDPAKFKQILFNYISNAIKFTPEHGKVEIQIRPEDSGNFRLEVKDNGIGIRNEDINKLFVEFQQLDNSAAKKYRGTGLGLALTRRIVEAQGGHVGVHTVLGQGSTFYAILPCCQSEQTVK